MAKLNKSLLDFESDSIWFATVERLWKEKENFSIDHRNPKNKNVMYTKKCIIISIGSIKPLKK